MNTEERVSTRGGEEEEQGRGRDRGRVRNRGEEEI